jgi:hypothetical protein
MKTHKFKPAHISDIRAKLDAQQEGMVKGCCMCLQPRLLRQFGIDWRRPDLRNTACLECRNHNAAVYRDNPDRRKAAVIRTQMWRLKKQLQIIEKLRGHD